MCEPGSIQGQPARSREGNGHGHGNGNGVKKNPTASGTHRAAHTFGDVRVEILGIAAYIGETNKVVLVDGQKPRVSREEDGAIIPAHYPLIAFTPGTYQISRNFKASIAFDYDLDGFAGDEPFEAFVLQKHCVIFDNIDKPANTIFDLDSVVDASRLVGPAKFVHGVEEGKAHVVAAVVDLDGAAFIGGESHGVHSSHGLTFGDVEINCAEKIVAEFRHGTNAPRIRLENEVEKVEINLIGPGPWKIMVGNVPVEELMARNAIGQGGMVPLRHNELIFDLYNIPDPSKIKVPTCRHHPARTADGHCGPPYKS